ncbi:MAG TPA: cytochrome c [Gemmataceae bacterium]|jgi:cytochrome c556
MKRRAGITLTAALLALGLWSLTAYSADDDDEKKAQQEAQKAVLKLMESMNGKGDVQAQVQAMRKKFDMLQPIMWVYKKKSKGGIGMGKGGEDDIELTLGKVGSKSGKINPAKIKAMKDDLVKAGQISRAIAEVTDLYAKDYAKKNPAKWKDYTKEMKKGADKLIEAAKGDDVMKIKKAANDLSSSCTNCHSDFRE